MTPQHPASASGQKAGAPAPVEQRAPKPERKKASEPERKCIATGNHGTKDQLIRFVVGPEGEIVPDLAEKLPGRGLWVTARRDALAKAAEKNLFARAAKTRVKVSSTLVDEVEALLTRRVLDHLGLAKRAGAVVLGFDKVEALLAKRAPEALIEAADGAEDGRNKLLRLLKKHEKASGNPIKVVGLLNSAELSLAFGRQHVIHAALTAAPVARLALGDLERLAGFRPMVRASWESDGDAASGTHRFMENQKSGGHS